MKFELRKTCYSHPYAVVGIACLFLLIITRGQVDLMGHLSIGLLIFSVGFICFNSPIKGLIYGSITGVLSGVLSYFVDNSGLISLMGLAIILGPVIYSIKKKDFKAIIFLIFVLGFYQRITYVLITDLFERQNDVGYFLEGAFDQHHAGYIQYIMHYGWIPFSDVREMDQWYHPPFYHLCAAYFMKAYGFIFPSLKNNFEALQLITLFCGEVSVITIYKILRYFDIKGTKLLYLTLFINVFPMFIITAGGANNDMMMIMFFLLSLYSGLLWYKSRKMKDIILGAFFVGLGMMTKLNCWLVAVPLGIMFLSVLIKSKFKDLKLWIQYLVFALISFPLGLWFPVRNFIAFGVPFTYVFEPLYEVNNVPNYSVIQRLFHLIPMYDDTYSIPAYTTYTALFDDDFYSDLPFFGVVSFLVLFFFAIIVILSIAGIIRWIITKLKNKNLNITDISILALLVAELISYVIFCFKFPYICTMNYRYIAPVTVTFLIGMGYMFDIKNQLARFGIKTLIISFSVLSCLFYSMLWMRDLWLV